MQCIELVLGTSIRGLGFTGVSTLDEWIEERCSGSSTLCSRGGWGLAFVDLWMKPLGTQSSGDSRRLGGLGLGPIVKYEVQLQVEASGPYSQKRRKGTS